MTTNRRGNLSVEAGCLDAVGMEQRLVCRGTDLVDHVDSEARKRRHHTGSHRALVTRLVLVPGTEVTRPLVKT